MGSQRRGRSHHRLPPDQLTKAPLQFYDDLAEDQVALEVAQEMGIVLTGTSTPNPGGHGKPKPPNVLRSHMFLCCDSGKLKGLTTVLRSMSHKQHKSGVPTIYHVITSAEHLEEVESMIEHHFKFIDTQVHDQKAIVRSLGIQVQLPEHGKPLGAGMKACRKMPL
eukprot:CAMPEP_0117687464 /NCGR_PEP_ID=MMETSP0804-20121206/23158_1 /TAXON_ID=1074897 /ORGANISM="Tetraselmis astigmatica, Strain CCMP880" /LENGTH=164 /DNA_ID=CAMNT_0005499547 /DNA_START=20 /DNA_END=514 /DNA_ORIENTATION=-